MSTRDRTSVAPTPGSERALTIGELNRSVRELLESGFRDVWLRGELSRFKAYGSGHWYFTLKDESASISGVMFSRANRACRVRPADGLEVLVRGRVSLYEQRGQYQVIVEHLEPAGEGALWAAFEKLKRRLAEEGLFAPERKRRLPVMPRRIGIATSLDGAALRDVLRVLSTRGARLSVVIAGCRVQGDGSASEIASALRRLDGLGDLDAVIVGRGGGSLEDLWAFNEEEVARAIHAMRVPVVSAVGHEIDTTIADLVADVRAATPSQAAELVCASAAEIDERLRTLLVRLRQASRASTGAARERLARCRIDSLALAMRHRLERAGQHRDGLVARLERSGRQLVREREQRRRQLVARLSPRQLRAGVARRREQLDARLELLRRAMRRRVEAERDRQRGLVRALEALSPVAVLDRGYAVLQASDGRVVRAIEDVSEGDDVVARLGGRDRLDLTITRRWRAEED